MQTPYELEVRDLLPSGFVASRLLAKLDDQFHDLLLSFIAKYSEVEVPNIQHLANELMDHLEYVRDELNDPSLELEDAGHIPHFQNFSPLKNVIAAITDTDDLSQSWVQEMIEFRSEVLQDLVLIDKRTNTPVSHRDVGIGVSQVLPVLVLAYAYTNKLLAIEQPEIHLHPALQAELGDVFLESALGDNGNTFLVETHSEHLLLRIMRRMRETSTDELPDGVPEVHPDDVIVLFVEADGPKSIVREMPLNERGELVKAWPGGFFEEGLREIF